MNREGRWGKGVYFSSSKEGARLFGTHILRAQIPDAAIMPIEFSDWTDRHPNEQSLGGLDYGFKDLFAIQWANEFNHHAARCYAANIGDHIKVGDLTTIPISEIALSTGFIGGHPVSISAAMVATVGMRDSTVDWFGYIRRSQDSYSPSFAFSRMFPDLSIVTHSPSNGFLGGMRRSATMFHGA